MEEIKIEQKRIQRLISISAQKDFSGLGSLSLSERGNQTYAYERWQRKGRNKTKEYLGNVHSQKVRQHIADKITSVRLPILLQNQKLLQKLEQKYKDDSCQAILSGLSKDYRKAARENSFNERYEKIKAWANEPYEKNPYPFPDSKNYAKDGTRLRSKGECVWYNLLQERGILFRNDCKMVFRAKNGEQKVLYPDFLIKCLDGTLIIIEHLGKLGNLGYAIDFGERCHWFLQEDFILGKNFFVTSDDKNFGTDSAMIAKLVDRIERMFYGY